MILITEGDQDKKTNRSYVQFECKQRLRKHTYGMVREKDQGKSKYICRRLQLKGMDAIFIYLFLSWFQSPEAIYTTLWWRCILIQSLAWQLPIGCRNFPQRLSESASNWVVHVFTAELQTLNLAALFLFAIFNLYVDHQFSDLLTCCEVSVNLWSSWI